MATVKDVISLMEEIAPLNLSDTYGKMYGGSDNSGFLIGDENRQIFSVLTCLDITGAVAAEAEDMGADMIISHHPLIFEGLKSVTRQEPAGNIINRLMKNDIAVYCAHLNFDIAPFGVNQIMADKLGLLNCKVLMPSGEDAGLGRIGTFAKNCSLKEICANLADITGETFIKACGDPDMLVTSAAVVCGAGGGDISLLKAAIKAGADVYITSEIRHHIAVYAREAGIALIDGGHFSTEKVAIPVLTKLLSGYAEKRNMDIEFTESAAETNPFNYYQ
jgi:dinuclear metal center YbgI/SA1388 family protein